MDKITDYFTFKINITLCQKWDPETTLLTTLRLVSKQVPVPIESIELTAFSPTLGFEDKFSLGFSLHSLCLHSLCLELSWLYLGYLIFLKNFILFCDSFDIWPNSLVIEPFLLTLCWYLAPLLWNQAVQEYFFCCREKAVERGFQSWNAARVPPSRK